MPDKEQSKIINEQLGGTDGAKNVLNKPFMENSNKEEGWEVRFDAFFDDCNFHHRDIPCFHDHIRENSIKIFIRGLLASSRKEWEQSSLKGERNRLMYQMKQEAKKELIEELEGKIERLDYYWQREHQKRTLIPLDAILSLLSSYKDQ